MEVFYQTSNKCTAKKDSLDSKHSVDSTLVNEDFTFSFVRKKFKKGIIPLLANGKVIALVKRGVLKLNHNFTQPIASRHRINLCKGVKVEEILFWKKFVNWANENIQPRIFESKDWCIQLTSLEEIK